MTNGQAYLSFLLPLQLNEVAYAIGLEPRMLLQQHTIFPYVTAFMPSDKAAALEGKILMRQADVSLASLTSSVTQAVPNRRVCKDCVGEELQLHGEAYWHRSHLLPGVHICPSHGSELWETEIPLRSAGRALEMPNECQLIRYRPKTTKDILEIVTEHSQQAISTSVSNAHARHRAHARLQGYVMEGGFITTRELSRVLHGFYGSPFLVELKADFKSCALNAWPALLVRTQSAVEAVPAKHILLDGFLFHGPRFTGNPGYATRGPKPDYAKLEQQAIPLVKRRLRELAKEGARATVPALLSYAGIWNQFRHNRDRFPTLNEMVATFRSSDLSERQAGGRCTQNKFKK